MTIASLRFKKLNRIRLVHVFAILNSLKKGNFEVLTIHTKLVIKAWVLRLSVLLLTIVNHATINFFSTPCIDYLHFICLKDLSNQTAIRRKFVVTLVQISDSYVLPWYTCQVTYRAVDLHLIIKICKCAIGTNCKFRTKTIKII